MRQLILIIFWIIGNFSYAASTVNISSKSASDPSILYSVSSGKLVKEKFDVDNPLNSFVEFEVTGTLESNYCGFNDFSLRKILRVDESTSIFERSYLVISPVSLNAQSIEVGSEFCSLQCITKPFSVKLRLGVNSWNSGQRVHRWEFIVKDYSRQFAKISISLDIEKGWTFVFNQEGTRQCGQHP